jgi:hypothetical protein
LDKCNPRRPPAQSASQETAGTAKAEEHATKLVQPTPLRTITASELMSLELPLPNWVVPGLLPTGVALLASRPKLGKSWLAFNLALGIASGSPVLGSISVEAGPVLYLALEDTPRRLQDRLKVLLTKYGISPPEGLAFASEWPRLDLGGLKQLQAWLEKNPGTKLLILDTLARVRPACRSNADRYSDDYAALTGLKAVADSLGLAVLVLHHVRKQEASDPLDMVSGTQGLAGAADSVMVLKRARGAADATLFCTGRDIEEQTLSLKFEPGHGLWTLLGNADQVSLSPERLAVIAMLTKKGKAMTPTEAAPLLGKTYEAVKKLLWGMAKDGQLCSNEGRYSLPDAHHGNHGNPVTG